MSYTTLSQALLAYDQYLQASGLAANTITNRTQVLRHASKKWGNPLVRKIRPVDVDRLFETSTWSAKTRNLYLGNLRLFFQFCRDRDYIPQDFDPCRGWRNLREPRSEMFWIEVGEFTELLDAAESNHPRDRMIVALGLFGLMRGSEVQQLQFGDVHMDKRRIEFYRPKNKGIHGIPMVSELHDEFTRYLEWVDWTHGPAKKYWYVTPPRKKGQYNHAQQTFIAPITMRFDSRLVHIYEPVTQAFAELGYSGGHLKGKLGNHALRRSGARNLLQHFRQVEGEQSALLRVSRMLGHQDLKDTMTYIGLNQEDDQLQELLAGVSVTERKDMGQLRAV